MKKYLLALAPFAPFAVLAADGDGGTAYAGSVAETIVTQSSSTLQNFITGAGTVVAGVIIAGLAIWGGIALVGIVKKAFSAGKGR